ncbi:hypothetical protein EJ02DRAFT_352662 [Clathrospora elynae]|uniref:RING-type domain-containing protein n=1 Tax=Clathrospora elynae TaxID=706981 RepID=A0A6A5SI31_9PLEO|nr:hypothetical protein EJ02DRAFT_352662 [Clathrospora elynae]
MASPHTAHSHSHSHSPLTGYDADFLDQFLPAYEPTHREEPYPFGLRFDDVYRASPSPPSPAFFDHILNPAGLDDANYTPFAYPTAQPLAHDMPPATRARPPSSQRPARLANGYVDLTGTPDSPPQRRKRQSPTPGPSAKRQKQEHGTATATQQESAKPVKVEEVDLTGDKISVQETLQKQREEAVKAQPKPEEIITTFNTFNCVICMDNPTDLTATACGHLFCHTCLMEALIAGENRTGPGEAKRSQCPVCRKVISRTKITDIIPLMLMKGVATQPRKKVLVASAATVSKVQ